MEQQDLNSSSSFAEFNLDPDIDKALASLGYEKPTPIQQRVIPLLLQGEDDLVGLAQTGTGKTAAFGIPLVQRADPQQRTPSALVLCPTRELCMQVAKDIQSFARFVKGLKVVAVYGGADIRGQMDALRRGVQIVVATPGRMRDILERKSVDFSSITAVVLDEADEMLNMGFAEDLNAILEQAPQPRRTLLFSATMFPDVAAIARKYMNKPVQITIGKSNAGADGVEHEYYMVQARDRYQALRRLVDFNPDIYALVFCRTRIETQEIADQLVQDGYNSAALHGDLSQAQRDRVMRGFRQRELRLLVATDVAARGLDVNDLSHVINYQLPDELAVYTHRSGRTGRAGKTGVSVSIIHLRERNKIRLLERQLKKTFKQCMLPSGTEVCERRLVSFIERIRDAAIDEKLLETHLPKMSEALAELDREDLLKRVCALELNALLTHYQKAPDLNVIVKEAARGALPRDNKRRDSEFEADVFARFELNIGKDDGVNPARLISHINQSARKLKIAIGRIDLKANHSVFDADERYVKEVLHAFHDLEVNGRVVSIRVVEAASKSARPSSRPRSASPRAPGKPRPQSSGPSSRKYDRNSAPRTNKKRKPKA